MSYLSFSLPVVCVSLNALGKRVYRAGHTSAQVRLRSGRPRRRLLSLCSQRRGPLYDLVRYDDLTLGWLLAIHHRKKGLHPTLGHLVGVTVDGGDGWRRFAGQRWLDFANPKIEQLVAASHEGDNDYEVIVDGNCSPERVAQAGTMGVKGFVLGTAGLFGHGDYKVSMDALRAL